MAEETHGENPARKSGEFGWVCAIMVYGERFLTRFITNHSSKEPAQVRQVFKGFGCSYKGSP